MAEALGVEQQAPRDVALGVLRRRRRLDDPVGKAQVARHLRGVGRVEIASRVEDAAGHGVEVGAPVDERREHAPAVVAAAERQHQPPVLHREASVHDCLEHALDLAQAAVVERARAGGHALEIELRDELDAGARRAQRLARGQPLDTRGERAIGGDEAGLEETPPREPVGRGVRGDEIARAGREDDRLADTRVVHRRHAEEIGAQHERLAARRDHRGGVNAVVLGERVALPVAQDALVRGAGVQVGAEDVAAEGHAAAVVGGRVHEARAAVQRRTPRSP